MIALLSAAAIAAIASEPDSFPHPRLPEPASWPGVVVIVILVGFFATAMVLGPIVRAIMGENQSPDDSRR